ncbi:hypothetical protein SADUNF_Sadunf05G0033800 [Salix dunnii]|uniref:Uncharacterized protein n=1 Tax=Salix dunnii TaxID=1413687 RepID=A0A835K9A8_9ROSI|nr:hypothetical protein SADUNF_Sadunf05G0033800 [Salix dunnii]
MVPLPTVSLLTKGSSCLAESCEVLAVVRYEVVRAKTNFQLFFCSLNNFTSWFRFLDGAGLTEDMRAELKVPHAHPITINIEDVTSRAEAIEAGPALEQKITRTSYHS